MVEVKIRKGLPYQLSLRQADRIGKFKTFENELKANTYATRTGGQLYTQVDGDDGRRYYLIGHHAVNRTGLWLVLKPSKSELSKLGKVI